MKQSYTLRRLFGKGYLNSYHYGYVGTRCGIDESTLQLGPASGLPGAGRNDEGDVISARIGINLWTSQGLGVSAESIGKPIVSQAAAYVSACNTELARGVRKEDANHVVITDNDYK